MEAALSDRLYQARHGTTDSELLFLLALEFGLESDPAAAFARAIRFALSQAARASMRELVRFTAAFSDGETLHAIRYSTDASGTDALLRADLRQSGPLPGFRAVQVTPTPNGTKSRPGSFVTLTAGGISSARFAPMQTEAVEIAEVA
jgi:predicted glutamine amidotransferase